MNAQLDLGIKFGQIHAARLERSPRLQRLLAFLNDKQWHGTREIMLNADICAVNTAIAELRANRIDVDTRCVGRGQYEYRVIE
jgi:hypothetical protein